jgi:ribosomal protein S27E
VGTRREMGVSKMEINCIGCGFKVDLAGAYDDYVGQIKCFACGAIMEIETQGGNVLAVNAVTAAPLPSAEVFVVRSVE